MTQLTIDDAAKAEGLKLKESGLDAIEKTDESFVTVMRREAIRLSHEHGCVTSDDLRLYSCSHGLYPKHANTWGSILRGPQWRIIGRKKSSLPSSHAREIKIWEWVG